MKNIINKIKSRKYYSIYILEGKEEYYINIILKYIKKNKKININIIDGKEKCIKNIILETIPIIYKKKIIIVNNSEKIEEFKKKKFLLKKYIKKPSFLVIIFIFKNSTVYKRIKSIKKKNILIIKIKKTYNNQLFNWINNYLNKKKLKITPNANNILQKYIKNNLIKLSKEINNIIFNIKKNTKKINSTIVNKNFKKKIIYNIYELQKFIILKNIFITNKIIINIKYNLSFLISFLFELFIKILLIHKNIKNKNLDIILNINKYMLKDYILAKKKYNLKKTIKNIFYIYNAEIKFKKIKLSEINISKELIYKIIH